MNRRRDNMTNEKHINLMDDEVTSNLVVEDQIARNITELLNDRAQQLKPEQEQRLSAARGLAIDYLSEQQAQLASGNRVSQNGNALRWFGQHLEQHRVTSLALILAVMLLTFFAVQHLSLNNNLENSDAFLLASDLPPEAYADKGFNAWLDSN